MAIVAGFDAHRAQITFDALDRKTGAVERGRIRATPEAVREWAERFGGEDLHVAVEACTGWLFVCEALVEAGAVPHLAEAVETRSSGSSLASRGNNSSHSVFHLRCPQPQHTHLPALGIHPFAGQILETEPDRTDPLRGGYFRGK